jgi:predicted neuraminidase
VGCGLPVARESAGREASSAASSASAIAEALDGSPHFQVEAIPVPDVLRRPYNHTATIAALPDGTLLVAWGTGSRELGEDTAIVLSRRSADGTWSSPDVVADRTGRADANGVLFRSPGGEIHLYYAEMFGATFCESRVMERRSGDGGATWSPPERALRAVCTLVKNPPIVLADGRWVLPAYVQGVYASRFYVSDDAGASWRGTNVLLTYPNNLQPAVVERSDGSLLALMRNGQKGDTWQGVSRDGGESWRLTPRPDLPNPNSGLDLMRHSSGVLVLACNDSRAERRPLVLRASCDEGETWGPPRVVSDREGQQSYPTLTESTDGLIHVVFSDDLIAIRHASVNLAWLLQAGS